MKTSKLIPSFLAVLFIGSTAFASTPNYEVWDYENDPLEEVLAMEEIPMVNSPSAAMPVVMKTMKIEAQATMDNYLSIALPYSDNDVVGLVIYDKKGRVVFSEKEEYRMLKKVLLADTGDNEYVIKAYKDNTIHQAKLKVVHE